MYIEQQKRFMLLYARRRPAAWTSYQCRASESDSQEERQIFGKLEKSRRLL